VLSIEAGPANSVTEMEEFFALAGRVIESATF
jgi:hypothetical protein